MILRYESLAASGRLELTSLDMEGDHEQTQLLGVPELSIPRPMMAQHYTKEKKTKETQA